MTHGLRTHTSGERVDAAMELILGLEFIMPMLQTFNATAHYIQIIVLPLAHIF